MRRETAVIVLLISLALVPMWYVALASGGHGGEQIALQPTPNSTLNPIGYFIDTPTEINVNVAGVVTWIALFGMVGLLFASMRFTHRVSRTGEPVEPGDETDLDIPAYLESEYRTVIAYWKPTASLGSVWLVGGFALLTVLFASLFAGEVFGAARNQFLGFYGGLLCLSFAETLLLYYTYFMPSIDVAEERDH